MVKICSNLVKILLVFGEKVDVNKKNVNLKDINDKYENV